MGIVYLISIIMIFISYLLIKKTEEKIDILKHIVLGIVLLFCYNAFICYVLTFFTIPVTLLSLSIINVVFSIIITVYLLKTKNIQKYKIEKIDILYITLLAIVTLIMGYLNFGFPFEIKYETGDPSVHYLNSEMFAEEDSLLAAVEKDEVYYDSQTRKTVSYVNSGLIMKCFQGIIDPFYNYTIFISFGIFVLFVTGWMFYSTIATFSKTKLTRFLAFIVSLLYMLGYPLNSFLFGFEYFSMGILILGAIIASVDIYQKGEIGYNQNLLVFFLLNFGLFSAYYMFVPYTYSALWIYFCYEEYKRQKKIFTKKTAILLFITLLLPFILGYIYYIAPEIYKIFINTSNNTSTDLSSTMQYAGELVNTGLNLFGYIYVNVFSNMLLLLPFSIVALYKNWKENKAVGIMTLFAMAFIILLIIGNIFNRVSWYYLSKNYYALWLFLFYLTYKGLLIIGEKDKIIPPICIGGYIIIIIVSLIFGKGNLTHGIANPNENATQVVDIYLVNKIILEKEKDLTLDELEILKYAKENIPEDKLLEVAGDTEQGYWEYSILRRINNDDPRRGERKLTYKMYYVGKRAGKVDYVIYFNRGLFYQTYKDVLWENAEQVYVNDAGGILKYNKKEN